MNDTNIAAWELLAISIRHPIEPYCHPAWSLPPESLTATARDNPVVFMAIKHEYATQEIIN